MSASAKASVTTCESKIGNSSSQANTTNFSPLINSPVDQITFLQRTVGNREVERLLKSGVIEAKPTSGQSAAKPVFQPRTAAAPCAPAIQAKLKVGEPDDEFEPEADRVAELTENGNGSILASVVAQSRSPVGSLRRLYGNQPVLQMRHGSGGPPAPAVPLRLGQSGMLQRKCACGGAAGMSGECEECSKKKRFSLQTKLKVNEPGDIYEQEADRVADQVTATSAHHAVSGAPAHIQRFSGQSNGPHAVPASVDQALASPGRPLEPALQQDMEQRFHYDFSQVRVHAGKAAEQSAREVNASAYTVGHAIVFGEGRFAPGTHQGRRLIAHELTHVVQQSGADGIRVGQSNKKCDLSLSAHYSIARKPRTGATDAPSSALKTMARDEARAVLAAYIATGGVDDTLAAMKAIEETLDTPSTMGNWRMRLRLLAAAFSLLDDRSAASVLKALTTPVGAQQEHLHKRFLRIDSDFRGPLLEILRERAAAKPVREAQPANKPPAATPSTGKATWIELHPGVFAYVPDPGMTLNNVAAYVSDHPDVPEALVQLNGISRTTPIPQGQPVIIPVEFIGREKAIREIPDAMRSRIASVREARTAQAQWQRFVTVRRPVGFLPHATQGLFLLKPIVLSAQLIAQIVSALFALIKKGAYAVAFAAGVVHGFLKSIWDAISGIAKLIYEVFKSILSGELVSDVAKLASSIRKLSWDKIKDALGKWAAGWAEKLESNNPLVAGHAHGYLTGYVMAEAAMLLLSGGTITELKGAIWSSKLGELVKGSRALQTLESGIAQAAKVRRAAGSEFDKAVDALRQSRLGAAVKAAEVTGAAVVWTAGKVASVLRLPGNIAGYVVEKAVAHAKQLGPFFDRIGALTERAKRWLFGCRSPCNWEADAVANTMQRRTNKEIEDAAELAARVPKPPVARPHGGTTTVPHPVPTAPLDLTNVASASAEVRKANVAKSSLLDDPGPQQLRHEIDEVLAHPELIKHEGARVHRPLGKHDWEHRGGGVWCRRTKETCVIIRRTQPGMSSEDIRGAAMESPQGQAIKERWLAESRAVESFPRQKLNDPVPQAAGPKGERRRLTPDEKKGANEILDAFDDYARGDQKAIDRLTSRRRKELTREPYIGWEEIDLLPNNPGYANQMRFVFRIVRKPSVKPFAIGGEIEVRLLQMH
jgi:hypothetical protein